MLHSVAILLAIVGAVLLSIGTQMQNSGVVKTSNDTGEVGGLSAKGMFTLLKSKRWVGGTLLLGGAIVFQLGALSLAPLMVVQPIGAIALVITTLLNARLQHVKLNVATIVSVACCVLGITAFVVLAATVAVDSAVTNFQMTLVLIVLAVVLAVFIWFFINKGKDGNPIHYILGAGVLYGFVATIAKTIISRLQQGQIDWFLLICAAGLVAATLLGGWFVQNAHTSGPPDLVVAGLTVIDPIVAVLIGIVILQEAKHAGLPTVLGFIASGIVAIVGVFLLARNHPQMTDDDTTDERLRA